MDSGGIIAQPWRTSSLNGLRLDAIRAEWMPYRLFPYERELGIRELASLGMDVLDDDGFGLTLAGDPARALRRSTYFASMASNGDMGVTEQAAVESVHLNLRDGSGVRQATRYGLHGIHEYKGKFNPQVVRSLCNVVDPTAEVLVDPFCGSGTSLVEALRLGMSAVGIDQSPMACFIAEAKLRAMSCLSKADLADELLDLAGRCAVELDRGQMSGDMADLRPLLGADAVSYLERWFTPEALSALANALALLDGVRGSDAGYLALVALSSILRQISLQLPEDLRVRRRPEPFTAPALAPRFLDAIDGMRRGLIEMEDWPQCDGGWNVRHSSAEAVPGYQSLPRGRRLIVTSPPYATALPYIDTDRLSVVALGLADSGSLLELERGLIGSREWTRAEQVRWDAFRSSNELALPTEVVAICERIDRLNDDGRAGFRRKAVPSLLYRYFARMGAAIDRWAQILTAGEAAVLIVGHNHTTAGGEKVSIPTPRLLARIAETRGFGVDEILKLETWPRYGLHAANGVPGEDAVVLRRARG